MFKLYSILKYAVLYIILKHEGVRFCVMIINMSGQNIGFTYSTNKCIVSLLGKIYIILPLTIVKI